MNYRQIESLLLRIVFVAAGSVLLLAFAEGFAQVFGGSVVSRLYAPSRMLEIGAVLLIFVMTLLLKQIRDQLISK